MLRGIVMDQACHATTSFEPVFAAERITHERPPGSGSSSASRVNQRGKPRPREPHRHLRKRLAVDRTAKIGHRFTNEAADSFIRKHAAKLAVQLDGDLEVNLQGPCDR